MTCFAPKDAPNAGRSPRTHRRTADLLGVVIVVLGTTDTAGTKKTRRTLHGNRQVERVRSIAPRLSSYGTRSASSENRTRKRIERRKVGQRRLFDKASRSSRCRSSWSCLHRQRRDRGRTRPTNETHLLVRRRDRDNLHTMGPQTRKIEADAISHVCR